MHRSICPDRAQTRFYLDDPELSFEAKGLLTMLFNLPFEQIWPMHNDRVFERNLHELQARGYIGEFGFDGWQICLAMPAYANRNLADGDRYAV